MATTKTPTPTPTLKTNTVTFTRPSEDIAFYSDAIFTAYMVATYISAGKLKVTNEAVGLTRIVTMTGTIDALKEFGSDPQVVAFAKARTDYNATHGITLTVS